MPGAANVKIKKKVLKYFIPNDRTYMYSFCECTYELSPRGKI